MRSEQRYEQKLLTPTVEEKLLVRGYRPYRKPTQEDIPSEFDETVVSFRRLLDQLDQARREKGRVYQEKQTLIADISHDLHPPHGDPGVHRGFGGGKVPPEKVGAVPPKAILTKSRLATDLVSDLFLFTQMEHPDYPMQGETANFRAFVRTFFAEKYLDLTEQGSASRRTCRTHQCPCGLTPS